MYIVPTLQYTLASMQKSDEAGLVQTANKCTVYLTPRGAAAYTTVYTYDIALSLQ